MWPGSVRVLGTRGRVGVEGTVDGAPLATSFTALGDGRHELPLTGVLLTSIGKGVGDTVIVHLARRL